MLLTPILPDTGMCKTRRSDREWECLVCHTLYYFECSYAADIDGACFCRHPGRKVFSRSDY